MSGDLQAPIISWQVKSGDVDIGFAEQRILLIAQGNGTATPKEVLEDVLPTEAETLLGLGSMAYRAYQRIKKYNKANEIDVITLAEPVGGAKAQGGISVTGTATENKTMFFKIGDDEFEFAITVLKTETAAQITTKLIAAINDLDCPFTASIDGVDPGLVLIDFEFVGDMGNKLIAKKKNKKDRVLGLTFSFVEFTGGAGAYDSTNIFDGITKRYQTILFDECASFDDVEEWLESRVNMSNTIKGGSGFIFKNGDYATLKAFANSKNSKTMTVFGNVDKMKFNAIPILAAAEFGAKRALRLTDGAVLGDLVVDAVEAYGGINKSSLPYHNTPMGYDEPLAEMIIEEVQDLNDVGLSLFVPATIGVVLGSVVALYKVDNTGIEDANFKYVNAVDTALAVQEYLFSNSQKEFGQTRATNGDLVSGVSMTNTLSVSSFIAGLYSDMVDMALVQGGSEATKAFKKNLVVTLDAQSGFYSVYAPVAIVSQFRGLNGVVAISYKFN
jgi:phage tail sheath gpL-like